MFIALLATTEKYLGILKKKLTFWHEFEFEKPESIGIEFPA